MTSKTDDVKRAEDTGRILRDAYGEADRGAAPVLAAADSLWQALEARNQTEQVADLTMTSPRFSRHLF